MHGVGVLAGVKGFYLSELPTVTQVPVFAAASKMMSQWCYFAPTVSAKNPHTYYWFIVLIFGMTAKMRKDKGPILSNFLHLRAV